ncbi:C-C motif chemokine 21c-like isoform 2-T2 [Leptodactylus fuscus]|uniref:C-C motif chemokine 21b-like isoform X2 n=1 Tax=Leptodactylus fuscus TaxID=238119 RepID=UPI003F4F3301
MAPTTLVVLLVVSSMYVISQVSSATMLTSDCCLTTKDKEIPYNNVKCYMQQTAAQGCYLDAIIFVTRKNRHLCAPPNSAWVKNLMAKLDKHKPHFKKTCGR